MRNSIYNLLYYLAEGLLMVIQYSGNFLLNFIGAIFNWIYSVVAWIFKSILSFIDKNRVYHAEQVIEQEDIGMELNILCQISQVKEDALRRGTWTSEHSEALNQLSQMLYDNSGWSKDKIHTYMRALVESIPGLSYVSGNDEDEDEDDKINI